MAKLTSIYNKDKQTDTGGGAARKAPTGKGRATSKPSGISEAQHGTVQLMQQMMAELKSKIYNNAETVHKHLVDKGVNDFEDPAALQRAVVGFANTSAGGTQGTFDGMWGGNTKKSLEAIKDFASKAAPGLTIYVGQGSSPFREMDDEAITKLAKENLENFQFLFSKLKLSVPSELAQRAKGGSGYVLDRVPQNIADENVRNPLNEMNQGPVSVKTGDLASLSRFLFLARKMVAPVNCQPILKEEPKAKKESSFETDLEKLATDIFKNSIFKLSQVSPDATVSPEEMRDEDFETPAISDVEKRKEEVDIAERAVDEIAEEGGGAARRAPKTKEDVKEEQEIVRSGYPCINQMDYIVNWFVDRADGLYDQLYEASVERNPHPIRGDAIIKTDMQAAEWYANQTKALANTWDSIRPDVYNYLEEKASSEPRVTPGVLRRSVGSGGAARRKGRGRGERGDTSPGGRTVSRDDLKGPLDTEIDLAQLSESGAYETGYEDRIAQLSVGGRLPYISRRDFVGDWVAHATTLARGDTNTERIYNYPELAKLLRLHINSLFNQWRRDVGGKVDRQTIARQNAHNRRWQGALKSAIGRSSGDAANRAAARYRGLEGEDEALRKRFERSRR